MSDQPLDALEAALGEAVRVHLKDGTTYHGELAGYDQHMNLVLESAATGVHADDADEPVEDTIVIRGDNVVSIVP